MDRVNSDGTDGPVLPGRENDYRAEAMRILARMIARAHLAKIQSRDDKDPKTGHQKEG